MHVTPRTCPGPGDLWQLSWQEEKRQAEYERLLEKFFEEYIPRYCDKHINELAEAGEDERHPEIEPLFDEYLKENEETEKGSFTAGASRSLLCLIYWSRK